MRLPYYIDLTLAQFQLALKIGQSLFLLIGVTKIGVPLIVSFLVVTGITCPRTITEKMRMRGLDAVDDEGNIVYVAVKNHMGHPSKRIFPISSRS